MTPPELGAEPLERSADQHPPHACGAPRGAGSCQQRSPSGPRGPRPRDAFSSSAATLRLLAGAYASLPSAHCTRIFRDGSSDWLPDNAVDQKRADAVGSSARGSRAPDLATAEQAGRTLPDDRGMGRRPRRLRLPADRLRLQREPQWRGDLGDQFQCHGCRHASGMPFMALPRFWPPEDDGSVARLGTRFLVFPQPPFIPRLRAPGAGLDLDAARRDQAPVRPTGASM